MPLKSFFIFLTGVCLLIMTSCFNDESWRRTGGVSPISNEEEQNEDTEESLQCVFIPSLPGDFDQDGCVTNDDLKIWQANYLKSNALFQQGDANKDGTVDGADYTIWADSYSVSCGVFGPSGLPGDANGDFRVTAADFRIWEAAYSTQAQTGTQPGDFNQDGTVDGADYTIWADNYGRSIPCK